MTSGKLGLGGDDMEDSSDVVAATDRDGGGSKLGKRLANRRAQKGEKSLAVAQGTSGSGGWLTSGGLGVALESDDDGDGDGDGRGDDEWSGKVLVTIETQTEEDIEGIVKRGAAPRLPPWAKPWVPPPTEPTAAEPAPDASSDEKDGEGSDQKVMKDVLTFRAKLSSRVFYSA